MVNIAITRELHRLLKIKAAKEGKTLQEVVEKAIKRELKEG